MRIFRKKNCKIASASGDPPPNPVGLRRLGAPPSDPTLYLPSTITCLSCSFLGLLNFITLKNN